MFARSRARIRARSLTILAGAVLTAGLAGCAAAKNSNVKVTGKNLTIYASIPTSGVAD